MFDDLEPLLKTLPPSTHRRLLEAIDTCSKKIERPPDWVQRWLSFTLLADALTQRVQNGEPVFQLKGGAAIELRLRGEGSRKPRVSKDLDATYRGELDDIQREVEEALQGDRQGFSFRLIRMDETAKRMRHFSVHVSYRGKSFSKVKLEISTYEGTPLPPDMISAPDLSPFGFTVSDSFPCIPLRKQIAQKLHSVTEIPDSGQHNQRFRDLVDIVLLSALEPASETLREACEETFLLRQKQAWPPAITARTEWLAPLEALAQEIGLEIDDADAIVEHVERYVADIASARWGSPRSGASVKEQPAPEA